MRFGARATELIVKDGRAIGVRLADGEELIGRAVVIATGHSARDVHTMLLAAGVRLEAKPFAMGVRIEHPQPLIDRIQYGRAAGHPKLPAAAYRLAFTPDDGRGAFSFCMCPGGWIVPAATEPDGLVVNGMSLSRRDSPFANSGLVVGVSLADLPGDDPLRGVHVQRVLEQAAAIAGRWRAARARHARDRLRRARARRRPCRRRRTSPASPPPMSAPCSTPRACRSRSGCAKRSSQFDRQMRGYVTEDAVLVGVESRTSSPVRIPRDAESLESPDLAALYPCAEGAGYAGGIVSAALDGIRVARQIIARYAASNIGG